MAIRLYLDEDSSDTGLLKALRLRGVDVAGAQECGMCEQSDERQLAWATREQRVLYSSNRGDFYKIHTEMMTRGESHAGIVLCPQQRYSVGEQMHRLLRLIQSRSAEDMRNRVEFLSAWG
jgi:hypothetical protein